MAKSLPKANTFKKIFEIADQSSQALSYAHDRLVEIAKSTRKTEQMKPVITELKKLADYLQKAATDSAACWDGEYKNKNATTAIQESIGVEACDILKAANITDVQHHISIKDNGEYERSFYNAAGQPVNTEMAEACDRSFNDWLAQNGILSKGSTLYEQDEKGGLAKDSKGKPVKADVSKVERLLTDSKRGFGAFMESRGIKLESNVHPQKATTEQDASSRSA